MMPDHSKFSPNTPQPLGFYGITGQTFRIGNRIIRGVYPEYAKYYRDILYICVKEDLFDAGLVKTWEIDKEILNSGKVGLCLEHERIPFISYPHEWPSRMFLDSALFHVRLNIKLADSGMILGDIHPFNVLFRKTQPVFVDFTSILFFKDLIWKIRYHMFPGKWLCKTPALYLLVLFTGDFFPYFAAPLYLMAMKRPEVYRSLSDETKKVFPYPGIGVLDMIRYQPTICFALFRSYVEIFVGLVDRDPCKRKYWRMLENQLKRIPLHSSGSGREDGREDSTLSSSVCEDIIHHTGPGSLLVLGNLEKVSISAGRAGCQVIAVDKSENRMNDLYLLACRENISILPLVIEPQSLFPGDKTIQQLMQNWPWYLSAVDRLKCDCVVVCLQTLVEISGGTNSPREIAATLNQLCRYHLFLQISDEKVTSSFARAVKTAMESYFPNMEILEHEDQNTMLIRYSKKPSVGCIRDLHKNADDAT
jgi:hypothetical protein